MSRANQPRPALRDAIFGNVGTLIGLRVGLAEALLFEQEFFPIFQACNLSNLPNHHVYLKLMTDGQVPHPFSARTHSPRKLLEAV